MRGFTILAGRPLANTTASSGNGAEYLQTPDPKEVWQAGAAGAVSINIDLGQAMAIDSLFLGFTNAVAGTTWEAFRTASIGGSNPVQILSSRPFALQDSYEPRVHGLALLDQPVTTRYLRVSLSQPVGAGPLVCGGLLVGKRFESPYEWKSGRRPIDLSERVDLAGGGFGFGPGAIKSAFGCTAADLDDADVTTLYRLTKQVGNRSPIVMVEGGTGEIAHDQLHYGVFERFEAYERENPDDTRWSLSMVEWA